MFRDATDRREKRKPCEIKIKRAMAASRYNIESRPLPYIIEREE